ncbi:SBBP repeat-containing protein [Roseivirga sp. BDSF3-8]|uniref:SBBP repeat-containing protein n=1 Tax=Roseivirga sp. BDSF3-8 TaxID=3241598 RepID=UPI003532408F
MRKQIQLFAIFLTLIAIAGCAEDVPSREDDEFVKIYGGTGDERGYDIIPTDNGGVLMLGSTTTPDTTDDGRKQSIYLVWADAKGDITKTLIIPSAGNEVGKNLLKTSDGFLVIAETDESSASTSDIRILRLSQDGTILSDQTVGFAAYNEMVADAISMPDGGYLIAGTTSNVDTKENPDPAADVSDILLIRISPSGSVVWTERYGFGGADEGKSVLLDRNGNIILTGNTDFQQGGRGGQNLVIYRINDSGLETAVRIYGSNLDESVNHIYQRQNQFFLIGSIGSANQSESAIWKLENTLDSLEVLTFSVSRNEEGIDMAFLNNDSYIVVSNASFSGSGTDLSYIQVESNGKTHPLATYGANGNDQAIKILRGTDGKISLFGTIFFENTYKLSWIKPRVVPVLNE